MQAVISGRAGVAIVFEGERMFSLNLERVAPVPCKPRDVRYLLGDAQDLVALETEDPGVIQGRLAEARDRDDALSLALLLLDADLSDRARDESAEALEEQIAEGVTARFVEGVLFSHPVPPSADVDGARRAAKRANADAVRRLFDALADAQPVVAEVWRAWEALPPSLFGGEDERDRTRAALVRAGWFAALTSARRAGLGMAAVARAALEAPEVRAIEGYEAIVRAWSDRLDARAPEEDLETGRMRALAERLHALSADRRVDAATQLAFGEIERRLSSRGFPALDALLQLLTPDALLPEVILAVLILTRFERDQMRSRGSFLARAEASLRARLGPERAERLLESRR